MTPCIPHLSEHPGIDLARAARASDPAWAPSTMHQLLRDRRDRHPDRDAVVTIDVDGTRRSATYSELVDRSEHAARALARVGVRHGDPVALWITNRVEWLYAYLGALRLGAVVVPVSTWLQPEEARFVLEHSKARHLIVLDHFRKISFLDRLDEIAPEWRASPPGAINASALPALRNVIVLRRDDTAPLYESGYDFHELTAAAAQSDVALDALPDVVEPTDLALIKFTSGSTSFPKGVLLAQQGLVTVGHLHARRLRMSGEDRFLNQMPFFHAGGSVWGLMTSLAVGATLAFTETKDGASALRLLREERCTVMFGLAPMVSALLDAREASPQEAEPYVRAAGALSPTLNRRVREAFGTRFFFSRYGMTEVYGPAAVSDWDDSDELLEEGWMKPLDGEEFRIVDPETGDPVPLGSPGEICMRGLVMRGYHELPAVTADTVDADGWIHSEDLGVMNSLGYVRCVGRIKAMLKVGGENVSALEVENCVRSFPGVIECAVIGVPDAAKVEVPRAYVLVQAGAAPSEDQLAQWCASRLASYKVPRDYRIVDDLPMTGSGKVDRAEVIRRDQASRAANATTTSPE